MQERHYCSFKEQSCEEVLACFDFDDMDKFSQKTCDPLLRHSRDNEWDKMFKYFKARYEKIHGPGSFIIPKGVKYLFGKNAKETKNHWKGKGRDRHTIATVCY